MVRSEGLGGLSSEFVKAAAPAGKRCRCVATIELTEARTVPFCLVHTICTGQSSFNRCKLQKNMAPQVGLEPTTLRLTGGNSPSG
jgi:hypothetical protein